MEARLSVCLRKRSDAREITKIAPNSESSFSNKEISSHNDTDIDGNSSEVLPAAKRWHVHTLFKTPVVW